MKAWLTSVVAIALLAVLPSSALAQVKAPAPGPAASAAFPNLPLKRDPPGDEVIPASVSWSAALVLLLGLGAWLVINKRRAPNLRSQSGGAIKIHSTALTQHASLHVVEWHGERLLLACTPASTVVVARSPIHPKDAP